MALAESGVRKGPLHTRGAVLRPATAQRAIAAEGPLLCPQVSAVTASARLLAAALVLTARPHAVEFRPVFAPDRQHKARKMEAEDAHAAPKHSRQQTDG